MALTLCRYCGGPPKEELLVCACATCGARTQNFTGCGGEYQKEKAMAEFAWLRGEYSPTAASIDHLLKDAERYRWLFSGHTLSELKAAYDEARKPKDTPQMLVIEYINGFYVSKEDVDAAIDKMREEKPE